MLREYGRKYGKKRRRRKRKLGGVVRAASPPLATFEIDAKMLVALTWTVLSTQHPQYTQSVRPNSSPS